MLFLPEVENNNNSSNFQLKGLVYLEVNLVPDQPIHLIRWSHVVIVVRLIPKIEAWLINQLASIVTDWVIFHLCADLIAATLLPKTPGSSTGFVVEAEHLEVEVLQEDR